MGMNMLAAKKVKLHGMQDSRWNVNDHLTQYKGLVKLFERDRKIIDYDTKLSTKKNKKEIKQVQKDITTRRSELENCSTGDRQQIRNLLAEDRRLKLAYQELHTTKIIDHIYQDNFSKRKMLDLLNYRLKLKTDRLIKLRLEAGDLENQMLFEVQGKTPLEINIGIVTGKVQDMILKKEAAITVKTTYKTLIDIMRKDAIYYDAVLNTLREDGMAQGHCLIQTTKLGQLATEYLDDRRVEFETLRTAVKSDMKARLRNLTEVRGQIEDTIKNLRGLIRRDSDLTVSALPPLNSKSYIDLYEQIQAFTKTLQFLQNVTLVSNFDCIFPCMEAQATQRERLGEFLEKTEKDRETLVMRRNHAEEMATKLINTMNETTNDYKSTKLELLEQIEEQNERKKQSQEIMLKRGDLMVQMRKVLQHLEHSTMKINWEKNRVDLKAASETSIVLPPLEQDGLKIIPVLRQRVEALVRLLESEPPCTTHPVLEMEALFGALVALSSKFIDTSSKISDADLFDSITFEDVQIPTHSFIKQQSKDIVHAALIAEMTSV